MKANDIIVKGKTLGKGAPLVCVPVMGATKEDILKQTQLLVDDNTDMIEWRVDAFSEVSSLNAVREVLEELGKIMGNSILVYTYRSKIQGGLGEGSIAEIYDLHQVAAESGVVDFVDVEYFFSEKPEKEIRSLQKMGTRVIASHHDFQETPDAGVIRTLLEQINSSGTDVVKLAVMPNDIDDVLTLLSETVYFHKEYPDRPLITMSMGPIGSVSRVTGEFFGSCVTFGAGECASAPGQLPKSKLENVLQVLHESVGA